VPALRLRPQIGQGIWFIGIDAHPDEGRHLVLTGILTAGLNYPANAGRWTIGMSRCSLGEPSRIRMNQEIEQAARKYPQPKVVCKDA
jgi:hypothetical protein